MNVYEIVTSRILADLENGTVPWAKPWIGGHPTNWVTGKPYRGVNLFLLPTGGEYVSFKQAIAHGGTVPKGTKSYMVVFFKPIDKKDATENTPAKPGGLILRYYNVFKIEDVGLTSKRPAPAEHDIVVEAEAIVADYVGHGGPSLVHLNSGRAFYTTEGDSVHMPLATQFPQIERYYCTLFHELGHSTGHQSRLDRFASAGSHSFGSYNYSIEELVAEFTAAMICAKLGISTSNVEEQSSAYIASWARAFKNDTKLIVSAAGKAQKAVDFIYKASEMESEGEIEELAA